MPAEWRASFSTGRATGRAKDDAEIRTARTIPSTPRAGQARSDPARDAAARRSGAGRHADTNAASDGPAGTRRVRATLSSRRYGKPHNKCEHSLTIRYLLTAATACRKFAPQ